MLDPDISTHDALAHLTRPAPDDALSLDRRRFLQLVGMGLGAGAVAGPGSSLLDSFVGGGPEAWASPVGAGEGIVVLIGLYGGNDGLNTVVPTNDGAYHDQRPSVAIAANQTLRLDARTGLHPELVAMKQFWDAGQLAIVEGVGHTTSELSHFSSLAKWMSGRPTGATTSGWIGRWLDRHLNGGSDLFAAAQIGTGLPLHMVGRYTTASAVPVTAPSFGLPRSYRRDADHKLFATVRSIGAAGAAGSLLADVGRAQADQLDLAASLGQVLPPERPNGEASIVGQLEVAARLINANLGFRVVSTGFGTFDDHARLVDQHPLRLSELNAGIERFFATLAPAWLGRVTVVTFSEFGRTSHANSGLGTDHGSSAPQFVMGAGVRGGFYGQRPTIAGLGRWERMATHVDMRSYYASIIDGWLGGGSSEVLAGNFENLGLFRSAPGTQGTVPIATAPPPVQPAPSGGTSTSGGSSTSGLVFRGVTPERVYDTRNGLGGRQRRIGPGETVKVKVAGAGPVPSSAKAVAVNVTAVFPSHDTFVTVFPTGQRFPDSSTLNPRPGIVTPNSTVVGVGDGGYVSIYNNHGDVDMLVDVMGYFVEGTTGDAMGFHPLSPSRLLDTREGNGAQKARVHKRDSMSLQVTGRGGVPSSGVDSVVVNLLAVDPSGDGWVVAWPAGQPMPVVSNVQYQRRRTVPTLAVVKVGQGGRIDLMASEGDLDMVVDVVGYFGRSGSTMRSVKPSRLLDTREGNGAPRRRVGPGQEVTLKVVDRAGVPAGASAAALNVTAVAPTSHTYVTVYPGGEARQTTSSLNPDPGKVSANLVVTKIGRDGTVKLYNNHGDVDLVAT